MKSIKHRYIRTGAAPSVLGPGLLLASLLVLFVATLLYVAYGFLGWGETAVASLPEMPALPLPQLVRAAPAPVEASSNAPAIVWQPVVGQPVRPQEQVPPPAPRTRITVLVMGVDSRPGEAVARTDTILLVTMDPQTGSSGMISLARDLLVHVPVLNRDAKINTVNVLGELNNFPGGGAGLLRETVSELLGYPVDYYVRLNFDGFRQIVDQIGGIDIVVPRAINDPQYPAEVGDGFDPLYIPQGRQHMNGKLALKYARTRHPDDDYGRAERQQQVVLAIKDKILQPGQLAALLPRLPGLALAMANSVQTDMPVDKALAVARMLDKVNLQNPTRVVVDRTLGRESTEPPPLGFVLIPDMSKLRLAAATVLADAPAGPSAEELARRAVQAENARVVVLNGSREEGLGARTAAKLSASGYNVAAVGNADSSDYAETWLISHGDTAPATREALVRLFDIIPDHVRSEPPSPDTDLTLIVGADQAQAATDVAQPGPGSP